MQKQKIINLIASSISQNLNIPRNRIEFGKRPQCKDDYSFSITQSFQTMEEDEKFINNDVEFHKFNKDNNLVTTKYFIDIILNVKTNLIRINFENAEEYYKELKGEENDKQAKEQSYSL